MRARLGGRFEAPCPFGGIKLTTNNVLTLSAIHLKETARTLVPGHPKGTVSAIGGAITGVVVGLLITLHPAKGLKSRSGRGSHLCLGGLDAAPSFGSTGLRSAMFALDHRDGRLALNLALEG